MSRKSQKSGQITFNVAAAMKGKTGFDIEDVTVIAGGAEAGLLARTVKKMCPKCIKSVIFCYINVERNVVNDYNK